MPHLTASADTRMRWRYALATLMVCLLPLMAHAAAIDTEPPEEDEAALAERERAHAERLRRAIEKSEQEQADHARRRDSEQVRRAEFTRLQSRIAVLERDESTLQGQMRDAEAQLVYMRRDPADMSAHARRSELESRVAYYRSQLHHIFAEKQTALRQINELRFRN